MLKFFKRILPIILISKSGWADPEPTQGADKTPGFVIQSPGCTASNCSRIESYQYDRSSSNKENIDAIFGRLAKGAISLEVLVSDHKESTSSIPDTTYKSHFFNKENWPKSITFLVDGMIQKDVPQHERRENIQFTIKRGVVAGTASVFIAIDFGLEPGFALMAGTFLMGSNIGMLQWNIDTYYKAWTNSLQNRLEKLGVANKFTLYAGRRTMRFSWALVVMTGVTVAGTLGTGGALTPAIAGTIITKALIINYFSNDFFEANRKYEWMSNKAINYYVGQAGLAAVIGKILIGHLPGFTGILEGNITVLLVAAGTGSTTSLVFGQKIHEFLGWGQGILSNYKDKCSIDSSIIQTKLSIPRKLSFDKIGI